MRMRFARSCSRERPRHSAGILDREVSLWKRCCGHSLDKIENVVDMFDTTDIYSASLFSPSFYTAMVQDDRAEHIKLELLTLQRCTSYSGCDIVELKSFSTSASPI